MSPGDLMASPVSGFLTPFWIVAAMTPVLAVCGLIGWWRSKSRKKVKPTDDRWAGRADVKAMDLFR